MGQAKTAALITLAVSIVAGPAIAAEPLRLVWADSTGAIAEKESGRVRAEVVRILDVIGLQAEWVADPTTPEESAAVRYVVVSPKPSTSEGEMGWCLGGNVTWISAPAIKRLLGVGRLENGMPVELAYHVALARAISHELLHSLLPGRPHGRGGLMAAQQGPDDLTGPVSLDRDWKNALSAL